MKIIIANDHGGASAKREILNWLSAHGYDYEDMGCKDENIVRYPYYAARVAKAISEGSADRGILICSTGIGMSIAANKYPGVRASVCGEPYTARMTRLHNDSNVLCLGGKTLGTQLLLDIVDVWLSTGYMGGRHDISLGLIQKIEAAQISGAVWNGEDETEYPWRDRALMKGREEP